MIDVEHEDEPKQPKQPKLPLSILGHPIPNPSMDPWMLQVHDVHVCQRFENSSRPQHLKKTWTLTCHIKIAISYLQNAKHEASLLLTCLNLGSPLVPDSISAYATFESATPPCYLVKSLFLFFSR